jgi:formate dehydrogenase maturation protein FdhE
MSYENRFNELKVTILDKNGKMRKRFPVEFEMSINYADADSMAVPEIDVRFITKSKGEFEDELQNALSTFAQHAKNREKFLKGQELTVVFDHNSFSFQFQEDYKLEQKFDEYFENGEYCPFCESTLIEGLEVEFEGVQCIRNVRCTSCEKTWTDVYRLVSIKNL